MVFFDFCFGCLLLWILRIFGFVVCCLNIIIYIISLSGNLKKSMDRFAVEAFLYSADFDEDNYLLASSSDDSGDECFCTGKTNDLLKSSEHNINKKQGFAEVSIPIFSDHEFRESFRINRATFDKILEIIQSEFSSNHKGGWERISPEKATYILLWYLGNQETFKQISDRFKVTMSTIHNIVKLGTLKLSSQKQEHILWPSVDEYPLISDMFEEFCKISGIIGAVGVSHFKIPKPKEESENYVRSTYHSIALQGVVTINKKFINIFISEGRNDPQDILNKSSIPEEGNDGLLDEFCLVGYNNYSNTPWLIQPFQDNGKLSNNQKHFNECHHTASDIVSETFGLLKGRFQRLQHFENRDLPFIIQCIEAACVIHNICIDCEDEESDMIIQDLDIHERNLCRNDSVGDDLKQREVYHSFIARFIASNKIGVR